MDNRAAKAARPAVGKAVLLIIGAFKSPSERALLHLHLTPPYLHWRLELPFENSSAWGCLPLVSVIFGFPLCV